MAKIICIYCGGEHFEIADIPSKGACLGCGSRKTQTESNEQKLERRSPFSYNGLIIWPLENFANDTVEFQFYAGDRLLEKLVFSREYLRTIQNDYGIGTDIMPMIWQLFEVANGRRDVGIIEDNSRIKPALIAFVRAEYPAHQLTWEYLVEKYKQNPQDVIRFNLHLLTDSV